LLGEVPLQPITSYTELWWWKQQRLELYSDRLVARFEQRWGSRAERIFALAAMQKEPDHYWAKDYGWAKVAVVGGLLLWVLCFLALSAWNGFTPGPEWSGPSFVLLWVLAALVLVGIALVYATVPRVEYTCYMRQAGSDGFWIGKRGPHKAGYEAFVAAVGEQIRKAAATA
jgi:hypothetical protein